MRSDEAEIESQAATWAELMNRPLQDARAAAEFDRWISADPRHVESYAEMVALWQSDGLDAALRLSAANGPRARNDNDQQGYRWTPGNSGAAHGAVAARTLPLWQRAAILASSILLLLLAIPVVQGILAPERSYAAARDANRMIVLADGSKLHLSGGSRLSVRMTPWSRNVRMEAGEAYFDVAHERFRSFSVDVGNASIAVLGTAFDVDMMAEGTREVRVYRGLVKVEAGGTGWRLPAGSGLSVSKDGVQRLNNVLGARPAWIDGWFDAQDTTLARLADRINRTSDRPVVLADPALGALRITGRFRMNETRELLETLAAVHDLRWEEESTRYILSR